MVRRKCKRKVCSDGALSGPALSTATAIFSFGTVTVSGKRPFNIRSYAGRRFLPRNSKDSDPSRFKCPGGVFADLTGNDGLNTVRKEDLDCFVPTPPAPDAAGFSIVMSVGLAVNNDITGRPAESHLNEGIFTWIFRCYYNLHVGLTTELFLI